MNQNVNKFVSSGLLTYIKIKPIQIKKIILIAEYSNSQHIGYIH